MGHHGKDDPIFQALRSLFGATVLKVPDDRTKTLDVIAQREDHGKWVGRLKNAFAGDSLPVDQLESSVAPPYRVADISGKRSSALDIEVGLSVLEGLLKGFNIPSAKIATEFKKARALSFKFDDVKRAQADAFLLGKVLEGQQVERTAATEMFFEEPKWAFLVIDSVVTSTDFSVKVEKSTEGSATVDLGAIAKIVGDVKTNVKATVTSELEVSFQGPEALTCAFTASKFHLDSDGTVSRTDPEVGRVFLESVARTEGAKVDYTPDRVILPRETTLFDWDET
jgi:hypothetical protein